MRILTIAYAHPPDEAAFDEYYRCVHRPLAEKFPGVRHLVVRRCTSLDDVRPPHYITAELTCQRSVHLRPSCRERLRRRRPVLAAYVARPQVVRR